MPASTIRAGFPIENLPRYESVSAGRQNCGGSPEPSELDLGTRVPERSVESEGGRDGTPDPEELQGEVLLEAGIVLKMSSPPIVNV